MLEALQAPDPVVSRRALSKAITLMESTRADHALQAQALLELITASAHNKSSKSLRIGISGTPGVGKSTFIERFGLGLIEQGSRVAVLAVDPSSSLSGGAILGDKTRMEKLSVHPQAFIRPSPSAGNLGGVCAKTRETLLLCEFAGYEVILVETVGVGQSEVAVANMTDVFLLMQLPNAGDDLQAIKKGVMEFADLVVINKADLDVNAAMQAQAMIASSLRILAHSPANAQHLQSFATNESFADGADASALEAVVRPSGAGHPSPMMLDPSRRVFKISALSGEGIEDLLLGLNAWVRELQSSGNWHAKRSEQSLAWFWERVESGLRASFNEHKTIQDLLPETLRKLRAGQEQPSLAARKLLELLTHPIKDNP
jgi:LAO/AO transport system kinase